MLLRTIENSGPFVFLVPVGGFCLHPWPVSNRKDTPCDWSLPQTIMACCYTGCKRAFLCHKATVRLVNSNAGNWHRGYICVCASWRMSSEVSHQRGMVACFWLVHKHTDACTASRSTEERAVCLHHSSRCRRGWTLSTVVLLHIPHKHTVSNPLNSSYSDVCYTLLTTVVTYLKNACYQISKYKVKEKEKNLNVYVDFCADMTCDSSNWP